MAASKALKLGPHLRELRIHLCQKSEASKGVREFIEKHYVPLKKSNPKFPILIRECSGIHPKIYARYGLGRNGFTIFGTNWIIDRQFGEEQNVTLTGLSSTEVLKHLETLAAKK